MTADWMQIVGTISAVSSLVILCWQVYKQVLLDCHHDPHALTDIQKTDDLHRKVSEIHGIISRSSRGSREISHQDNSM